METFSIRSKKQHRIRGHSRFIRYPRTKHVRTGDDNITYYIIITESVRPPVRIIRVETTLRKKTTTRYK